MVLCDKALTLFPVCQQSVCGTQPSLTEVLRFDTRVVGIGVVDIQNIAEEEGCGRERSEARCLPLSESEEREMVM